MSKCFCHFNGYEVKDANARNNVAELQSKTATLESRMNTFSKLPEGSTTGDAELIDARVDCEGDTWENVGEHIRGVTSQLSSEIEELKERPFCEKIVSYKLKQGIWTQRAIESRTTVICVKELMPIKKGDTIKYDTKDLYMSYGVYVGDDTVSSGFSNWFNGSGEVTIEYDGMLFVQFAKDPETKTAISINDFSCDVEVNNRVLGHRFDEVESGLSYLLSNFGNKNIALSDIDETLFGKYIITNGTLEENQFHASTREAHLFNSGNFISIKSDTFRVRPIIYTSTGNYMKELDWITNGKYVFTDEEAVNNRMLRLQITTQAGVTGYNFDVKEAIECIETDIETLLVQKYNDVCSLLKANSDSIKKMENEICIYSDTQIIERVENIENVLARDVADELTFDVCIVGGGAGGIGASYALKNSGLNVCLIEEQPFLGGTHTQAWVNSMAGAPSPKFLEEVVRTQIAKGQACFSIGEHTPLSKEEAENVDFKNTYLGGGESYNIVVNPRSISLKYYEDLAPHINIMLNTSVVSANASGGVITDITTNAGVKIKAKQFIDCSAQNVLLALTGAEMLCGGDSKDRYYSEYGFTEENAPNVNYDWCNSPTLFYRVDKGREDLTDVEAKYSDHVAYAFYKENPPKIYMNTFNYVDDAAGEKIITSGIDTVYHDSVTEAIKHWKTVKNGMMKFATPDSISNYKFDDVAPMLGIRELYRAKCERMLHESDLYNMISLDNIKSSTDNLDKIIAVGNSGVDVYGDPYLTHDITKVMDERIRPYGVPYGCIIPKGYTNVLLASRGAGMTHIANSSFRLTKHMMQLGYVAGNATKLLNENELTDFRNVDVETLQTESYADVVGLVNDVLSVFYSE